MKLVLSGATGRAGGRTETEAPARGHRVAGTGAACVPPRGAEDHVPAPAGEPEQDARPRARIPVAY
ncbi:hypothetical protein [Streptomyces sp. NPDC054842]